MPLKEQLMQPCVKAFFDSATFTFTYVVWDSYSRACAVIDPVLDYEAAAGRVSHQSADQLIAFITAHQLQVQWILETHVHADHWSAAAYVKQCLGGRIGIGAQVVQVQKTFAALFNLSLEEGAFDVLFADQACVDLGSIPIRVWHTPGHTPACVTYLIGDAAFVGDTLFMPDYGSARCDFPGGDARTLYQSIQRLFQLPDATRVFLCHDYKTAARDQFVHETLIGTQKTQNIHVHQGVSEADFVAMRTARDAQLKVPALLLPAVQVNIHAGRLPPAEANGTAYLKIPLNVF